MRQNGVTTINCFHRAKSISPWAIGMSSCRGELVLTIEWLWGCRRNSSSETPRASRIISKQSSTCLVPPAEGERKLVAQFKLDSGDFVVPDVWRHILRLNHGIEHMQHVE